MCTSQAMSMRSSMVPCSSADRTVASNESGISHCDAAERSVDIHALRTTAATRMLRYGVPVHVVARILGHKDVRLTLRHYEDLRVEDTRRAVDGIPDVEHPEQEGGECVSRIRGADPTTADTSACHLVDS